MVKPQKEKWVLEWTASDYRLYLTTLGGNMALTPELKAAMYFESENNALLYRAELIRLNPTREGVYHLEAKQISDVGGGGWIHNVRRIVGKVFSSFAPCVTPMPSKS